MVLPAVDLARLVALPAGERLALVQALWDSLRADVRAELWADQAAGEAATAAAPR